MQKWLLPTIRKEKKEGTLKKNDIQEQAGKLNEFDVEPGMAFVLVQHLGQRSNLVSG